jgi:TetR/AcrR family transcriptional regulator, transcriptional repressor for nem operon
MARPRRSDDTREKLLEKGMRLLWKGGYHGTGLKTILDTVRVPKGSFYNYFKSKEQFVSEIIGRYSQTLTQGFEQYVASTDDDPVTVIRTIYSFLIMELDAHGRKGCLIGNLAAEIGNASAACQSSMQEAFKEWKARFVELITDAQARGLVRSDLTAEALTDIFWSTWQGGLIKMKIDGDTAHLKQLLDMMLDSLFKPNAETTA